MHPMAERSGEFQSLDGRRVAFSRYGPDGGRPVLFHYGSPGTRHLGPRMVDAVERHGVQLLVLERPGYGASTRRPGRSIADVVADAAALVEMQGMWESYWSSRQGVWRRRFRHAEQSLAKQGEVSHVRYRPRGQRYDDGDPRWDLYDACEELAQRSWQGAATDGTTLSHPSVRQYLRETHEAAAAAGAVDLNLLCIGGSPVAFVYGYCHDGSIYGLRRGYDAARCRGGAGNVLLCYTLRDSFARGDRRYDMGVGSLASKRSFLTRRVPILRVSHFARGALRAQLVRLKRWWQSRQLPASTAVDRAQEDTADAR